MIGTLAAIFAMTFCGDLPEGYWPAERVREVLGKTLTVRLEPDLSHLTDGERAAAGALLRAGEIFQDLYEEQRHAQALAARADLRKLAETPETRDAAGDLLALYRLNQGPVATTLDNAREPFLPVEPFPPGKNVYPWGVTKGEIEAHLQAHPEDRAALLDPRTVVRRATTENLRQDLDTLAKFPALAALHPRLERELKRRVERPDPEGFYALPYAVAYADRLAEVYVQLNEAADAVEPDDAEFARYLRNRARDLLSNDYESGDASWVTGRFRNLNAQIGAYETYDDELYGVKAFFSLSLLAARPKETADLRRAIKGLQRFHDALPGAPPRTVREDIPVGVYDVVADFGQARGGNTASILPNESYLARRYGRTILLRSNIMRDERTFENTRRAWAAAVAQPHEDELTPEGNVYRTLWHEVGHYLGVDRTRDGRELDIVFQEDSGVLEELKADLVSLFLAEALRDEGYHTDARLRSVYAGGVFRVLQNNKPRRDQPYNTMQLMQWNYFLEHGLLSFDARDSELAIDYGKYHGVVGKMLGEVLELQDRGDKAAADRFIERYTTWDEEQHGAVARRIREQQRYRFRLYEYAGLPE